VAPAGSGTACTPAAPCALDTGLSQAQAGDEVVLLDGTYDSGFTLSRSGTASQPIVIRAQHPHQATFTAASFSLNGHYAVLDGFVFEGSEVVINGGHNRVTRNYFRDGGDADAVAIKYDGSFNRVDHNDLTSWPSYGFRVYKPTSNATGNRIDHNYAHDINKLGGGTNDPEIFQVGTGPNQSGINVAATVEYNLTERVHVEGEILSLKSSSNIVRGNTFRDITGTVQARHGLDNTFINNTIINMQGGMQGWGDRHRFIGNRLVNAKLFVPTGSITEDDFLNGTLGHPVARDQLIAANRVEDGGAIKVGQNICCGGALPAQNTRLEGNIGTVTFGDHEGTVILPTYDGDAGQPCLLTPDMVGPDAPDTTPACGGGDLDGDGQVTLADLRLLLRMLVGQVQPTSEAKALAAPADQVSLADAQELVPLLVRE
jgi:hypothetical protein